MLPVFSKYHSANVRALKTLHPNVRPLFYEGLIRLALVGIYIRISAAYRTPQQQHQIFLQGRPWLTGGSYGPVVTDADYDNSFHCYGVAIDVVPMRKFGPFYYTAYDLETQIAMIWKDIGIEHPWPRQLAKQNGGFVDEPHFQYTAGLTLPLLKNGQRPAAPSFQTIYPSLPTDIKAALAVQYDILTGQGVLPLI